MPGGDGTGPMGMGPMSGRGAGDCAGFGAPGYMNALPGRGMGSGRGRGRARGWRHMLQATGLPFWARTPSGEPVPGVVPLGPEEVGSQTEALKAQVAQLERSLEALRRRISELETPETGQR